MAPKALKKKMPKKNYCVELPRAVMLLDSAVERCILGIAYWARTTNLSIAFFVITVERASQLRHEGQSDSYLSLVTGLI